MHNDGTEQLPATFHEEGPALLTPDQVRYLLAQLTPRQTAWYLAYRATLNATEAARRAGYKGSPGTLRQIGYKNLHHPKIIGLVADSVRRRHMTTDEVMARLAAQARSDLSNFVRIVDQGKERYGVVDIAYGIEAGHALELKKVKQKRKEITRTTTDAEGNTVEVVTVEMDTTIEVHNPKPALETMLRASGKLKDGITPPEVNLNQFFVTVRQNIMGRPDEGVIVASEDS